MELSDFFTKVTIKTLAAVDLPHSNSNQHEINGAASLREFFESSEKVKGDLNWFYFGDGIEPASEINEFTFYDARAKTALRTGRTEWRMYYRGDFLSHASEGDILVLARENRGAIFALVFQKDSMWLQAARVLFGFKQLSEDFQVLPDEILQQQRLEFVRQRILESLGIEVVIPAIDTDIDLILRKFGNRFPKTHEMSQFARSITSINPLEDADIALMEWLQREEDLFRALEEIIVSEKLKTGFESVDDFIRYSLSVQNRRKSRMGHSLMHHLSAVFSAYELKYQREAHTEKKHRPDFLFPGVDEYRNPAYDESLLVMLAAKSSVKERWRQILVEANRIRTKHLCTLEYPISIDQIDEMTSQGVALVIPSRLQSTYPEKQTATVLTLNEFILFVRKKQTMSAV